MILAPTICPEAPKWISMNLPCRVVREQRTLGISLPWRSRGTRATFHKRGCTYETRAVVISDRLGITKGLEYGTAAQEAPLLDDSQRHLTTSRIGVDVPRLEDHLFDL
jgi:hypothetical protein